MICISYAGGAAEQQASREHGQTHEGDRASWQWLPWCRCSAPGRRTGGKGKRPCAAIRLVKPPISVVNRSGPERFRFKGRETFHVPGLFCAKERPDDWICQKAV